MDEFTEEGKLKMSVGEEREFVEKAILKRGA